MYYLRYYHSDSSNSLGSPITLTHSHLAPSMVMATHSHIPGKSYGSHPWMIGEATGRKTWAKSDPPSMQQYKTLAGITVDSHNASVTTLQFTHPCLVPSDYGTLKSFSVTSQIMA